MGWFHCDTACMLLGRILAGVSNKQSDVNLTSAAAYRITNCTMSVLRRHSILWTVAACVCICVWGDYT